jgi:hypothetical protein
MLGAIGLAVGAVLGALVPQSEQEEAALGDVGRRAREGAGDLAQEVVDRGATVARGVLDAARDSASNHGLSGKSAGHFVDEALKGNLVGSASGIAKDMLKAGETAVRKAGLGQEQQEEAAPSGASSGTPSENGNASPGGKGSTNSV